MGDPPREAGEADFHDLIEKNVEYGDFNVREVERLEEIKPWVKWGEYVTIEIDTVERTAVVLKQDDR